jgi:hypothetical protein
MTPPRSPLRAAALVGLGLAAAGCTAKMGDVNSGLTIHVPGTIPATAQVPRPPAPPSGPPPSGAFSGTATLASSAGSGCRRQLPITGLTVTGDRVRYQGFRGAIQPDGFVRMQAGSRFLYGFFDDTRFTGHLWQPHPECTYDLVLAHAG